MVVDFHDFKLELKNSEIKEKFDRLLVMLNMLGYRYKIEPLEVEEKNGDYLATFVIETFLDNFYFFDLLIDLIKRDDCFYLGEEIILHIFSLPSHKNSELENEYNKHGEEDLENLLDLCLSIL